MQHQQAPDDLGRRSRFMFDPELEHQDFTRPSRAASQPPQQSSSSPDYSGSSPGTAGALHHVFAQRSTPRNQSPLRVSGAGWPPIGRNTSASPAHDPSPVGIPTRSVSFSASEQTLANSLMAHMREQRMFPSPFEDDEESVDEFDSQRGGQQTPRDYQAHDSRSRSQSFATTTRRPSVTSSFQTSTSYGFTQGGWGDRGPPPAAHGPRYNAALAPGRIDTNVGSSSQLSRLGYRRPGPDDHSNMSPFVRDVSQIFTEDAQVYRDPWGSSMLHREDGGGSGTTSRRHSVSVVQPRRSVPVGFTVPGEHPSPKSAAAEIPDSFMGSLRNGSGFGGGGRGGGMFSEDELAGSLNMLNLDLENEQPRRTPRVSGPSQPSSLPTYTPQPGGGQSNIRHNLDFGNAFGSPQNSQNSYTSSTRFNERDLSVSPGADRSRLMNDASSGNGQIYGLGRNGNGNGNGNGLPQAYSPQIQRGFQSTTFNPSDILNQPPSNQQQQYFDSPGSPHFSQQTSNGQNQSRNGPALPPLSFQGLRNPNYPGVSSPLSPHAPSYPPSSNVHSPPATSGPYNNFFPNQPHSPNLTRQPSHGPPSPTASTQAAPALTDLGRGVPLYQVPPTAPLYIVEFKAGRTDIFYCSEPVLVHELRTGDLVIVEADRGKDLGKITNDSITPADVEAYQRQQAENAAMQAAAQGGDEGQIKPGPKELMPKRIYGKALPQDTHLLASKSSDEAKALQLCQSKVRQKKLPMEVVDAEYQWDRRKLTFYFVADRRIDFRELVRELFRLYKTRIWMASLQGPSAE